MVQVLIAAAMIGGLSLVVGQLGKNSADVTRRATNSSEINEAFNRVQQYFLHSESCTETFDGISIPISANTPIVIPEIKTKRDGIVRVHFTKGEKIGKSSKVILKTVLARRKSANFIEVQLQFNRGTVSKEKLIFKTIEIAADFNGNLIKNCYSKLDDAVESACTSLGGTISGSTCIDTALHRGLCAAEVKIMQLTGVPGSTSCGIQYQVVDVLV